MVFTHFSDLLLSLQNLVVKQRDLILVVSFKQLDLVLVFAFLLFQLVAMRLVSFRTVFPVLTGNLNSFSVVLDIESINFIDVALLPFCVQGVQLVDCSDVRFMVVEQFSVFILHHLLQAVVFLYYLLLICPIFSCLGADHLCRTLNCNLQIVASRFGLHNYLVLLVNVFLQIVENC